MYLCQDRIGKPSCCVMKMYTREGKDGDLLFNFTFRSNVIDFLFPKKGEDTVIMFLVHVSVWYMPVKQRNKEICIGMEFFCRLNGGMTNKV